MSTIAWIILLVLLIPMLAVLAFVIIAASLVRVPSGSLGLVMTKGKATDTALLPGAHFVPAIRRRMVEEYPSTELAYRAGGQDELAGDRDRPGQGLRTVRPTESVQAPGPVRSGADGDAGRPNHGDRVLHRTVRVATRAPPSGTRKVRSQRPFRHRPGRGQQGGDEQAGRSRVQC